MGIWSRSRAALAVLIGGERKMNSLELFREIYGGRETGSGITVNAARALEVSTWYCGTRVLAEGVAQIPWRLYLQTDGGRKPATEHPLYDVIYRRPNSWQTSFEFRESMMFHLVLTGNAFVFANRVGMDRRITELVLITGRVEVRQNKDMSLTYRVSMPDGQVRDFPQAAIWHVRGPSWNTIVGLDAVKQAREALGLSIALEQTHANYHKNGTRVSGLLSVKDTISQEQYEFLSAWLDKYHTTGERAGKAMLLDRGAEFTPMGMTGVDAQHIETRKHQIEEIARALRLMPIMLGHADKTATYASAEQMFLAHVVHSLAPWYERIEQSADINLLSEDDRRAGYYTKFTPNALMRGAAKDRAEFYAKALGAGGTKGWLTQNEVRDLEEQNRSDDPEADKLPQPTAKAPTEPASQATEEEPADAA